MNSDKKSKDFILIDGGLGSTLADYGLDIHKDPLWSGRILIEKPEQLAQVHRDFVRAEADIIATGSYQLNVDNLKQQLGLNNQEAEEILFNSVRLAQKVIEEEGRKCLVAGSCGPYGAILHDGSEYNGWYSDEMSVEQLKDWHRPRLSALIRAEPDLIAFETIPSRKEGEAIAELLREFPNIKAWISFSCQDSQRTAHGERIEEAAGHVLMKSKDQLVAIGVNCVPPENVLDLIGRLKSIDCDLIAYPNAGISWDGENKQFTTQGLSIVSFIPAYLDAKIKYIGGCCKVNPNEIRTIRKLIDNRLMHSNY